TPASSTSCAAAPPPSTAHVALAKKSPQKLSRSRSPANATGAAPRSGRRGASGRICTSGRPSAARAASCSCVRIVLRSTTWTERTVAMPTAMPSAAVKERAGLDAKLLQASVNAIVTHCVSVQGLRRVDAAVLQEVELVRAAGVARVVGDQHDGALQLVGDLAEEPHHLEAGAGGEVAGRLVREDDARPVHDRARDARALHLAARELVGQAVELVLEVEAARRVDEPPVALRIGHALQQQRQRD